MPDEKTYTVDEANALLPVVIEQLKGAVEALQALSAARAEVAELEGLSRSNGHGDIDSRLSDVREQEQSALDDLRAILDAFEELDIQVGNIETGLIDFPGQRDGRKVWLCWITGEAEVAYWHEITTGFAGRQPL